MPPSPIQPPKHVQVWRHVVSQIQDGRLKPGDRLPSEASLCQQCGVSRITVRRAVVDLVREGYIESRSGFGHVVRSTDASPLVGALMNYPIFGHTRPDWRFSRFAALLMNAIRLELHRRGFRSRLYLPEPDEDASHFDHAAVLDDLDRGILSGLITAGWPHYADACASDVHLADARLSQKVQQQRLPVVSVTSRDVVHASVGTDYFAIGYQGAEYFLRRGKHAIGLLTLDRTASPTLDGFQQALADYGLRVEPSWVFTVDHHSERAGYGAFTRWWAGLSTPPQALVIDDDQTAKGAMLAAVRLGLDSQEQLAIACQSLRGLDYLWPRPCVKLEMDPTTHAREAVAKIAALVADASAELPRSWIPPTLREDQLDVAAPPVDLGADPSSAPRARKLKLPAHDTTRRVEARHVASRRTAPKGKRRGKAPD